MLRSQIMSRAEIVYVENFFPWIYQKNIIISPHDGVKNKYGIDMHKEIAAFCKIGLVTVTIFYMKISDVFEN